MNANVVVSAWTLVLLVPAVLLLGFGICAAFVIAGERLQRRWIKRAVPILEDYHKGLVGLQAGSEYANPDLKRLVRDIGKLLKEQKSEAEK